MELTYDENKFVDYFTNNIYYNEVLECIELEKNINETAKLYSQNKIEERINIYKKMIELTEEGYLLNLKFNNLIKDNDLNNTITILLNDFSIDFTLDTIKQIIADYNIHQFKKIKEKIYLNSPFAFNELFNQLNRPVEYHKNFIDDVEKIILVYCYSIIINNLNKGLDFKIIMDNFKSENDFRLFPYYHYNYKPLKENNKDFKENKYPEVFTDDKSFNLFLNIIEEFGTNKNDLANYSYIFHYLKKNNYIISNCLHKYYITILTDNNITISRIKPEKDIGDYLNKKRKLDVIIESFK